MRDSGKEARERAERRLAWMRAVFMHPVVFGLFFYGVSNFALYVLVWIVVAIGADSTPLLGGGSWIFLTPLLVGICVGLARFLYVRRRDGR